MPGPNDLGQRMQRLIRAAQERARVLRLVQQDQADYAAQTGPGSPYRQAAARSELTNPTPGAVLREPGAAELARQEGPEDNRPWTRRALDAATGALGSAGRDALRGLGVVEEASQYANPLRRTRELNLFGVNEPQTGWEAEFERQAGSPLNLVGAGLVSAPARALALRLPAALAGPVRAAATADELLTAAGNLPFEAASGLVRGGVNLAREAGTAAHELAVPAIRRVSRVGEAVTPRAGIETPKPFDPFRREPVRPRNPYQAEEDEASAFLARYGPHIPDSPMIARPQLVALRGARGHLGDQLAERVQAVRQSPALLEYIKRTQQELRDSLVEAQGDKETQQIVSELAAVNKILGEMSGPVGLPEPLRIERRPEEFVAGLGSAGSRPPAAVSSAARRVASGPPPRALGDFRTTPAALPNEPHLGGQPIRYFTDIPHPNLHTPPLDAAAARSVSAQAAPAVVAAYARRGVADIPGGLIDTLARSQMRLNQPESLVGQALDFLPPTRRLRDAWAPIRKTSPGVANAVHGSVSSRVGVASSLMPSRQALVSAGRRLFGDDVFNGAAGLTDRFVGTAAQRKTLEDEGLLGTLFDAMEHRSWYNLTAEQTMWIDAWQARNQSVLELARNMGLDITERTPPDGVYLGRRAPGPDSSRPNVLEERLYDTALDRLQHQSRAVTAGIEVEPWSPQLDIGLELEEMDRAIGTAIGRNTLTTGVGALSKLELAGRLGYSWAETIPALQRQLESVRNSLRRLGDARADAIDTFLKSPQEITDVDALTAELSRRLQSGPRAGADLGVLRQQERSIRDQLAELRKHLNFPVPQTWRAVPKLGGMYLPKEDAARLTALLGDAAEHNVFDTLVGWAADINATGLSLDLSPIVGTQGQLYFFADPVMAAKRLAGAGVNVAAHRDILRPFREEHLADWLRFRGERAVGILEYLGHAATHRAAIETEFSTGWLRKFKWAGPKIGAANEGMFGVVLMNTVELAIHTSDTLISQGVSREVADATGAYVAQKAIPMISRGALGVSEKEMLRRRALFTSVSFLTQPVSLVEQTVSGMVHASDDALAKILRNPRAPKLTPVERASMRVVLTAATAVSALLVTGAVLESQRTGRPLDETIIDAFKKMRFTIPGTGGAGFSIGGPFGSNIRAVMPKPFQLDADTTITIPGPGLLQRVTNVLSLPVGAAAEVFRGKEFGTGAAIRRSDLGFLENLSRSLIHLGSSGLPLTFGNAIQDVARGEPVWQIMGSGIANLSGGNLVYPSPSRLRADLQRRIFHRIPAADLGGRSFEALLDSRAGRDLLYQNATPDERARLGALQRQADQYVLSKDDPQGIAVEARQRAHDRLAAAETNLANDPLGYKIEADSIADGLRAVYDAVGATGAPPGTAEQKQLEEYYNLFKQAEEMTTPEMTQQQAMDTLSAKFFAGLTPEEMSRLWDNVYAVTDPEAGPLYRALKETRNALAQSGYYDLFDMAWTILHDNDPTAAQYASYAEMRRGFYERFLSFLRTTDEPAPEDRARDLSGRHPANRRYSQVLNALQTKWALANPAAAQQAQRFGLFDPTRQQRAAMLVGLREEE